MFYSKYFKIELSRKQEEEILKVLREYVLTHDKIKLFGDLIMLSFVYYYDMNLTRKLKNLHTQPNERPMASNENIRMDINNIIEGIRMHNRNENVSTKGQKDIQTKTKNEDPSTMCYFRMQD
jgi:hypothetical protein